MNGSAVEIGAEGHRSYRVWRRITKSALFGIWFPALVYLVTRLHGVLVLSVLSSRQPALGVGTKPGYFVFSPLPAAPGYWGVITNWDGQWYKYIATEGYRLTSSWPVTDMEVIHAWAFPPIFPYAVRSLMGFGMTFEIAATALNFTAGLVAMILLYRLLSDAGGPRTAIVGVVVLNSFPSAALFQTAYSEATAFALLMGVLLLARRKKYWWASAVVVALSLTRIITAPLAIVAVVQALDSLRARVPISRRESIGRAVFAASALGASMLWSALSTLAARQTTGAQSRPAKILAGNGNWFVDSYELLGGAGPILVALGLTVLVLLSLRDQARLWGLEARTWLWAYPLYLALVTPITSGIIRYLLLCFPLGLVSVGGRKQVWIASASTIAGLLLQWWWVRYSFIVGPGTVMP